MRSRHSDIRPRAWLARFLADDWRHTKSKMRKNILKTLGAVICTLLVSVSLTATEKSSPTVHKTTATAAKTVRSIWPPETLNGKIIMVDPDQHLVVVKSAEGVPFDVRFTKSTLIRSGDQRLKPETIKTATDKKVSVKFRPERSGNIAMSIQILAEK